MKGVLLLLIFAQTASGQVDRKKFETVYRAGKSLEANLDVGAIGVDANRLISALGTEASIAEDSAATAQEHQLAKLYSDAFAAYRDALKLRELAVKMDTGQYFSGTAISWTRIKNPGTGKEQREKDNWGPVGEAAAIASRYVLPTRTEVHHDPAPFHKVDVEVEEVDTIDLLKIANERLRSATKLFLGSPK
jgi:hypothetical protein